jgi:hypothetical protein
MSPFHVELAASKCFVMPLISCYCSSLLTNTLNGMVVIGSCCTWQLDIRYCWSWVSCQVVLLWLAFCPSTQVLRATGCRSHYSANSGYCRSMVLASSYSKLPLCSWKHLCVAAFARFYLTCTHCLYQLRLVTKLCRVQWIHIVLCMIH